MGTFFTGFFRRTGLPADVARVAVWVVAALLLGVVTNALSSAKMPLWPAPSERAAMPSTVWKQLKFADAEAAREARGALLVDVRDPHDYAEAHPPGAANLPYRQFTEYFPDFRSAVKPATPLYLYCYDSRCGTSLRVAKRLLQNGFTDVSVIRGGFQAWQERGLPTEQGGDGHD